ncbi:hypothetical protein M8818_000006 [Zalaria obscura]|uniref:Uncharacterized protein n=1 Tax=Zalaria obscura TaxID=2024903 RepID=A0ACC3SND5_9PEZI
MHPEAHRSVLAPRLRLSCLLGGFITERSEPRSTSDAFSRPECNKAMFLAAREPHWRRRSAALCVYVLQPGELLSAEGTHTILMDDGINDDQTVHPFHWHDQFTVGPTKRIVRIETVAANIMRDLHEKGALPSGDAISFPTVQFVLLHSSYPYTREAGYLATVYKNAYLDIGEVFPMVGRDGQMAILREAFELTPISKILWSTDGHHFPETYWLGNKQFRECLETLLVDYVEKGDLTVKEAIDATRDIMFYNSKALYNLDVSLENAPSRKVSHTTSQS